MPLLTAVGTLSYNDVSFDGTSQVTVRTEFVKDDAQRTTLYHRITLTVKAIFVNDSGTNSDIENIRKRLGEHGRELRFIQQGFGNDLIVNAGQSGTLRDVKWGPRPDVLSWQPIGSAQACEVEWQCVTCVAMCQNATVARSTGIMAINYTVNFSIDDRGYTTRSISGYLEIAQTRIGRTVPDSADQYRNAITIVAPLGFTRSQSWNLSADKSRVDFSVTDTEIPSPNAYPQGVVKASGRHRASWSRGNKQAHRIKSSITLDIEMAANQSMSVAYAMFASMVRARGQFAAQRGVTVLLESITAEESLFERKASFSAGYVILSSLGDLVTSTGLWSPLGTDWRLWAMSMRNVLGNRGTSGLQHVPANDAIVDMCGGQGTLNYNPQQQAPLPNGNGPALLGMRNLMPAPQTSWMDYQSTIEVERDRPVARQAVLQTPDQPVLAGAANLQSIRDLDFGTRFGTDDVIQESGRSQYTARLKGYATRAGYPVPKPALIQIGNQPATESHARVRQQEIGNFAGVPVFGAMWDIEYVLPNSPGQVAMMPDLYQGNLQ